ncbi:MAG: hypothetical protein H6744_21280 [Deltaproteobacteria bacterium]|nr:hypothetical protein [Deltaproteobacteria bacterium]
MTTGRLPRISGVPLLLGLIVASATNWLAGCDDTHGAAELPPDDVAADVSDTGADASGDAETTGPDAELPAPDGDGDAALDAADDAGPELPGDDADAAETQDASPEVTDTSDATDSSDASELPDAPDTFDTSISEEAISIACAEICGDILERCEGIEGVGTDATECELLCVGRLETASLWTANYECTRLTCDPVACKLAASALPFVPACGPFCEHADACGELDATGALEGELGMCAGLCSGQAATSAGGPDIVACANDAYDAGACGAEQLRDSCALPTEDCAELCERFYIINSPDHCYVGSEFLATWPTTSDCVSACESAPTGTRAQFFGCVVAGACEDPSACVAVSPTVDQACAKVCAAAFATCEGDYSGLATVSFCSAACAGGALLLGLPPGNPNAADCFDSYSYCPEPGTRRHEGVKGVVACAAAVSPKCDQACTAFGTCETMPSDRAGCVQGCQALEATQPAVVDQILQCVTAAAGDCAALAACVPQ